LNDGVLARLDERYYLILELSRYMDLEDAAVLDIMVMFSTCEPRDGIVSLCALDDVTGRSSGNPLYRIPIELQQRLVLFSREVKTPSLEARRRDRFAHHRLFNKGDGIRIAAGDVYEAIIRAMDHDC
jgi:hypothetical protein